MALGAGVAGALSIDGVTWSNETLPSLSSGHWSSIASGLQDDGSSTFKESSIVLVANGSNDVAYSADADNWSSSSLPAGLDTSG